MRFNPLFGLFIVLALAAGPAFAQRLPVPLVNHPDVPVATSSGKSVQVEQVKEAIQSAAKAKGWALAYELSGKMLATLVVRNKHTVVVEVAYSADRYSLMYRDSVNMKYAAHAQSDGRINSANTGYIRSNYDGPVIHPFYNSWVQEFKDAIRVALLKL